MTASIDPLVLFTLSDRDSNTRKAGFMRRLNTEKCSRAKEKWIEVEMKEIILLKFLCYMKNCAMCFSQCF